MKKITLIIIGLLVSSSFLMAGGLVHNTNQSAAWSRMLSRGATLEIDAVYYNPAGLTKLKDGFHISISNQSIFQTQTITSTFPNLNNDKYEGKIAAPMFPSVYLAYKTGKWAFSFGFLPIGGGGGATFDRGVPLMEVPVASLVSAFGDLGVTGYSVDMTFEGTSVYWGLQAGVSYALTENVSIFAGARYIMAKNTYTGHLKDIKLQTQAGDMRADEFMLQTADQAEAGAVLATGAAAGMQPIIDGGGGALTWDEAVALGVITETQKLTLQGGLSQFGFTNEEIAAMNMEMAQGAYYGTATALNTQAVQLRGAAPLMGDQEGDITQTGNGITPIIGANFSFLEDAVNIGVKYEFKTKMELTNEVPAGKGFVIGMDPNGNPIEMFPNDSVTNADIPAMLSVGMDVRPADPLLVSFTYHHYFDKGTEWGSEDNKPKEIDNNFWEFAIGAEYSFSDNFMLSAGFLRAQTGVTQAYQSNLGFSLTSNTVGFGGAYKFNDMFKLNLGGYYVMYDEMTYNENYSVMGALNVPYEETYLKSTFAVALGLDITLGSKK